MDICDMMNNMKISSLEDFVDEMVLEEKDYCEFHGDEIHKILHNYKEEKCVCIVIELYNDFRNYTSKICNILMYNHYDMQWTRTMHKPIIKNGVLIAEILYIFDDLM
jgi:hypothetical protein